VEATTLPEETELQWIARAQNGDRQAFSELVYHYREGVINVVYRMCGDANLAEDAAQEAFIRAWQNLPRYQPRSPFRNWLYRIATNVALDVLRHERESADVEDIPLVASNVNPEAAVERNERAEWVRQAVMALAPASRAVLILREYEALSYKEIAETLDIPMGTVMSRLNYARTQLRETLKVYLEGG
jgi:RNA polymerase sigma-70 factor (ECF subfamily)